MKSGFVAVVGRPNVGKSTLVNNILGQKVAIISDKPQTTRNDIKGIYTSEEGQIVFVDTPGIHLPKDRLGEYMVEVARRSLEDVDVVLYVVEATDRELSKEDRNVISFLRGVEAPIILLVNKVDLLSRKEDFWEAARLYAEQLTFHDVLPISAYKGTNLDELLKRIFELLPEGEMMYPEEQLTDRNLRFLAAEIVREKIFANTFQEVPYSAAVLVEEFKERENGSFYISATIFVEREGQKGILIGEGGQMIKKIGSEARRELEFLLGGPVYLDLWVKVKKDWRDSEAELRRLGYA